MKDLLYYTIGFSASYIQVIQLSINTVRISGWTGDIAIICDHSLIDECKKIIGYSVIYLPITDSKTPEGASMNKLHIFDFPIVSTYDRVMFLDGDIVVHMDLSGLFSGITSNNVLYVCTESTKHDDHRFIYWSLESYTPSQLAYLKDNSIHVFNAGTFAFIPSVDMKEHFDNVLNMISSHHGRFFYEQSFMNVYFNLINRTDRTVFTEKCYVFDHGERNHMGKLIHFAGNPGNGMNKHTEMSLYINRYLTS